jgi:beta-glucosidase
MPQVGLLAVEVGDGPHGLRHETGVEMERVPSTCFPTLSLLGASWDPELMVQVGEALGREASALGVGLLLGPGINLIRTPLCGRSFEYPGEDPLHVGALAAAYVRGVQSVGVGACLKHFAANNQEVERTEVSVEADERTLREMYLRAFERVIRSADPWSVMCSYNRIGGVHASQHEWLLTRVLRDEWGYGGAVVSDWDAVHDAVAAVRAGLDLRMPGTDGASAAELEAAVTEGSLSREDVLRAAHRVAALAGRIQSHAEQSSPTVATWGREPGLPLNADERRAMHVLEHHALAHQAAAASMVLLRNEGVLPLAAGSRVAVVGAYADKPRIQGGGSAAVAPVQVDSPLEALRAAFDVEFAAGYPVGATDYYREEPAPEDPTLAARLADEAVALAADSDVTVAVVGVPLAWESEAADRTQLELPAAQADLLVRLAATGTRLIVIVMSGGPVAAEPWHDGTAALLWAGLSGEAVGGALAALLTGEAEPSGRLAVSWPVTLADGPAHHPGPGAERRYPGVDGRVHYEEGVLVGYRWYDARELPVLYPFGHGLGYAATTWSDMVVERDGELLRVQVGLTNHAERHATEVVQIYAERPLPIDADPAGEPVRGLAGFVKTAVAPGKHVLVETEIALRDVARFDAATGTWRCEQGVWRISAGASSRDLRLSTELELPGLAWPTIAPDAALRRTQSKAPPGPALPQQAGDGN